MTGTTTFVKSRKGGTVQFVKTGTIMFVKYSYKQYQKDSSSSVQYGRLFSLSDGSDANNGLKKINNKKLQYCHSNIKPANNGHIHIGSNINDYM